jgi:hypothetical protein
MQEMMRALECSLSNKQRVVKREEEEICNKTKEINPAAPSFE